MARRSWALMKEGFILLIKIMAERIWVIVLLVFFFKDVIYV
jgi:hypothetical protein